MTCTWPVDRTCLPPAPEGSSDEARAVHAAMLDEACDTAVAVLWALTGRQFCAARTLTRPCPGLPEAVVYTGQAPVGFGFFPQLDAGVWRNVAACSSCSDIGPSVVHLPGPVLEVLEVRVGETVIDPSSYRLEGHRLYRTHGVWPSQDLQAPAGNPGTWTVEYLRGNRPPAGAANAVGELAKDFVSACSGGKCRLPRRVISVQRQGVSYTKVDPVDLLDSGATGIPSVDVWVRALNPHRVTQPATVTSPDVP